MSRGLSQEISERTVKIFRQLLSLAKEYDKDNLAENKTESSVIDGLVLLSADSINYWFSCFFQKKQLLDLVDYSALPSFTYLDDERNMAENNKKQIVVGMSGGVDSSMALVLLKEQGWHPVGVSLRYAVWQDKANLLRENVCCSVESFKIAGSICKKLGVPYHIVDVSKNFKKEVIDYFVRELKDNKTPNPCIVCNRNLKFKELFVWAKEHKVKYVATGHYAKIQKNPRTQKYELLLASDKEKDQTYSLSFLPQQWLKHIVFPLADYTKQQVFRLAEEHGFDFFLKRKQSQDFCFVAGKSMGCFLEKEIGKKQGQIKDSRGNVLAKHQGLHFYTLGQRKGLKIAGGPYFVVSKDEQNNVLFVTDDEKELCQKEVWLLPYHFIAGVAPRTKIRVRAKVRYRQPASLATLFPPKEGKIKLVFDKPQKAVTPGQFAVFYQNDICLGGGKILCRKKSS